MAHAYTPGLRVTARTVVRKTRRLPLSGDVVVSTGDRVDPGSVVAETHLPGNVHNVNVANSLGISAGDINECMLVKIGDRVEEETVLAESKGLFGWFKSVAKSPTGGTLEMVSDVTGQVLVREPPIPVQVKAYLEGEVVEVLPKEGVVVETVGTFIQGIFGIGGEVHAPIMMIKDSASAELSGTDIDKRCAGKIVCGGALASLDVLEKLRSFGAAGIVVGGVRYHDVGELLGYQLGVNLISA